MDKKLLDILFTEVKKIEVVDEESKRFIAVTTQNDESLTFYVKSQTEHKKWVDFCRLLAIIPTYFIPDPSRYSLLQMEFYNKELSIQRHNAEEAWVVYIINEGVGHTLGSKGFHIITIGKDSTLNILDYDTEAVQVTWDQDKIRRSGCVESLVFVEAGRRCHGGPGMLWMYCPGFALSFRRCLHSFLFDKAKRGHPISPSATVNSGADLVSIDSSIRASRDGLNDFNNSYEQNGSFSSQPHPSPQDHRRLTCSSSLPSEVSASVKSHPLLKISKSSPPPLLSYVHPKPGCYQEQNDYASVPLSKPPIVSRKCKPPIPPRTTRKTSSEEDKCMKNPASSHCSADVSIPSSEIITRSRSHTVDESSVNPHGDGYRRRLKTHEMVVLKDKNQARNMLQTTNPLHSPDHIGELVLMGCSVELHNKLDITSILPFLSSQYLLTRDDTDVLTNATTTNNSKISHLLKVLPRKDKGWFDKFLYCLHHSSEGNGHAGLVEELESKFDELSKTAITSDKEKNTKEVPKENYETYPIYLELPNESSPYTISVMPTDLVESVMEKIGRKLNIKNPFDIILKVAGSQRLDSRRSLMESKVFRNSRLSMVL
ncbi:uncharacterized protein [Dysidea avara]